MTFVTNRWEYKWTQWSDDKAGKWLLLLTRAVARLIGRFWLTAVLACLICDSQTWCAGRGKPFTTEYFYLSVPKATCLWIFFFSQVSLNLDVQLKNIYDRYTVLFLWWYLVQGSWGWAQSEATCLPSGWPGRRWGETVRRYLSFPGWGENGGRWEVGLLAASLFFLRPNFPGQMLVTRALLNSRYSIIHRCTQLIHERSIFIQLVQIRNR